MCPLNLDEQALAKLTRCKNELLKEYFNASIVEKVTNAKDYDETARRPLDFLRLGRWYYIPEEWFTDPSIFPDLVFGETGRSIALGEEKHIVEKILENDSTRKIIVETVDSFFIKRQIRDVILRATQTYGHANYQIVIFAPIAYFVAAHIDWPRQERGIVWRNGDLFVDGLRIELHWSNKYIDYKELIILEKSMCCWIAKPTVGGRMNADVTVSNQRGQLELKAQSVFSFLLEAPENILVVRPTNLPER